MPNPKACTVALEIMVFGGLTQLSQHLIDLCDLEVCYLFVKASDFSSANFYQIFKFCDN